jgi:hypothetical protein
MVSPLISPEQRALAGQEKSCGRGPGGRRVVALENEVVTVRILASREDQRVVAMEMNGVRQSLGVIRRCVCYGRCGGCGKTDIPPATEAANQISRQLHLAEESNSRVATLLPGPA